MTEAPYDDRTRPLLLQQAATRGAEEWRHEDAEAVISMLLAKLDRSTETEREAEVAKLREALEGLLECGIEWSARVEAYDAARAALKVTP